MKTDNILQITITGLSEKDEIKELVISEMLRIGFDSFWEDSNLLYGYINSDNYKKDVLDSIIKGILPNCKFRIIEAKLENKNWNEEWEKNFQPVEIEDKIYVYAPFHNENNNFEYKIKIMPKMSFGTAHHQTTSAMLQLMLNMDFENKHVIDAGTGTGILAIFAEMKKAKKVLGYDNDEWSIKNSLENIERNNCKNIEILLGENEVLKNKKCDILLANIHKNVILHDISSYCDSLQNGGYLLLSGFYSEDLPNISEACEKFHIEIENFIVKENWVAARFIKQK